MVFEGQESAEEDAGRPLRRAASSGRAWTGRRRGPTRWAWARSTSTCAAARAQGIVSAGAEYKALQDEIAAKLVDARRPRHRRAGDARGLPARRHLQGRVPAVRARPAGRASTTATAWAGRTRWAAISRAVVENNNRKWSGDHCATATEISGGVFFVTARSPRRRPHIMDLSPTILKLLGVPAARRTSTASPCCERPRARRRCWRSAAWRRRPRGAAARRRAARARRRAAASPDERRSACAASRSARPRWSATWRGCAARRRACWARSSGWSWRCGCAARSCARRRSVLQRTNAQLDATVKRRAARWRRRCAEARPVLAARARALYKLGELSYLRLLLSVDRPSDIFRGYRFVTRAGPPRQPAHRALPRRPRRAGRRPAPTLERQDRRRRWPCAPSLDRARRSLDADRRRKTELLTALVEKKETHAAYLAGAGGGGGQARASSWRAWRERRRLGAHRRPSRARCPGRSAGAVRVAFGRRKHPRFDTYTVQNGIEIEAPRGHAGARRCTRARWSSPTSSAATGSWWSWTTAASTTRSTRTSARRACRPAQRVAAGEVVGTVGASSLEGPRPLLRDALPGPARGPAGVAAPVADVAAHTRPERQELRSVGMPARIIEG